MDIFYILIRLCFSFKAMPVKHAMQSPVTAPPLHRAAEWEAAGPDLRKWSCPPALELQIRSNT